MISIAVLLACAIYFLLDYFKYKTISDVNEAVQVTSSQKAKTVVQVPVDFDKLKAVNEDVYAWLNVPGTSIDYPLLHTSEDDMSYYLSHDINRNRSSYGAIYTQPYNSTDFNEFNTVIYGHNMRNGTMFGTLKRFRDKKFFDEHNVMNIYLPGRILKYRIFAAYVFDDRHIMMSFDFKDRNECQLYLDTVYSMRGVNDYFREGVNVTPDDRIVTLSTCTSKSDERYLVQGVLIYDSDEED